MVSPSSLTAVAAEAASAQDGQPASDAKPDAGLPLVSGDEIEQDFLEEIDNIVPTRGYQLLPLVGLGGSAGSIGALQQFFQTMPPQSGMAFVVILHLSPEFESTLPELLARSTTMKVMPAENGIKVLENTVYVIPPGKHLTSTDGHLKLTNLEPSHGKRVAVDLFFRSLADTHGPHSAAIVLSGADGDGAIGIKRIKERGGLTIAQDPDEAEHPSMPRSAIDTGMVDWVLQVQQMPARLIRYQADEKRLRLPPEEGPQPAAPAPQVPDDQEKALRDVLAFLRARTGRDFSYYKRATIVRRISRRMQVNGVDTLPDYLDFMRTHPGESGALLQDLLISVTNFFRDRDSFAALEARLPEIFEGKKSTDAIRVWVAACATGEEAYSMAMLLHEYAGQLDSPPMIQIFATDLDEDVISVGREALYSSTISADVSEERLRRFFVKEHRGYRLRREIRESVLFAMHDLLKDAPFSRLDLVSCRNLLIYLTREAQARVYDIFHFALRPGGRLFLGSSELVDEENRHFLLLDKKHRIYAQVPAAGARLPVPIGPSSLQLVIEAHEQSKGGFHVHGPAFSLPAPQLAETPEISWTDLHFKLIERFAPPSVIVNRDYELVHVSENAGRFLHFAGGEPSVNLLKAVHPMLRIELRAALFQSAQTSTPVEVFRLPMDLEGGQQALVDIRVSPAQEIAPDYLLVVFAIRENGAALENGPAPRAETEPAVRHLERELEQMKSRLRDTIEQYEASSEELKASNEELQAMNEELRSATEELETSREELQSINEELTTVNQELKSKVEDLGQANSDLSNLMSATAIATIFLDRAQRIMFYTPSAVALFNLIPSDLGRPLMDLTHQLNYAELERDASRVLEDLIPIKREVSDGRNWFLSQLLPYRTAEDRIGGVVLTFVDITESRKSQETVRHLSATNAAQLRIFNAVMASAQDLIYYFSLEGRFTYANQPLLDLLEQTADSIVGKNFHDLQYPPELADRLQAQIAEVIATGRPLRSTTAFTSPRGEERFYEYIFTPLQRAEGGVETVVEAVVGVTRDVTEQTLAEAALLLSQERLRLIIENAREYAIFALDTNRRVTNWNSGAERLLGWAEAEIIGSSADVIFTMEDRSAGAPVWEAQTALAEGRAIDERWHVRKDGSRFWGSGAMMAMHAPSGDTVGLVKIFRDQTEERIADQARQQAEERLRALVNQSGAGVAATDLQHRYTLVNERLCAMLGRSREELLQMCWTDITHPDDLAHSLELSALAIASGNAQVVEKRVIRANGEIAWVSDSISVLYDQEGKAESVIMIVIDITDRMNWQLEQAALLAQREKDEQALLLADRRKNEFLATLAHEIRNPLAPINSALEVLRLGTDDESSREARDIIQRQVTQIVHLVEDLLDISRISEGKIHLRRTRMNLLDAVHSALEASRPLILRYEHQLHVALPSERLYIDADLVRISQSLLNLLNNAAKYTNPGGQIWLRVRREETEAVVRVRDSGVGIAPEMLERIFDIFAQTGDPAHQQNQNGLGIGLSLVKKLVEMHGGTVEARSEGRGEGSEFVLRLPLAASQEDPVRAPEAPTSEAIAPAQPRRQKVLIVDDNVDAANMLNALLSRHQHTVEAVYDAETAIRVAGEFLPEAVLLDIGLPDMDGCELAKILRQKYPEILLIAISGWGQKDDLQRTREAGCNHHFTKPVQLDQLNRALNS